MTTNLTSTLRYAVIAILACFSTTSAWADLVQVKDTDFDSNKKYYLYNMSADKWLQFVADSTTYTQDNIINATPLVASESDATGFTITQTEDGYLFSSEGHFIGISKKWNATEEMYWNTVPVSTVDEAATFGMVCNRGYYRIVNDTTYWKHDGTNDYMYLDGSEEDGIVWKIYTEDESQLALVSLVDFNQSDAMIYIPENLDEYVTVRLHRDAIIAGTKNGICLPFDMSTSQIKKVFGSATQVYTYSRADENALYYSPATNIVAGKPYMIIPSENRAAGVDYYEFEAVESSSFVTTPSKKESGSYAMVGTFVPGNMPADSYAYDAAGVFYHYPSAQPLDGFRSYITPITPGAAKITGNDVVEFETDGISNLTTMSGSDTFNVYNVNGQIAKRATTSLEGLSRGIYIVNGKKIVVK